MKKNIYTITILVISLFLGNRLFSQSNCNTMFVDSAHLSNGCVVDFYHTNSSSAFTSHLSYNFGDGTTVNTSTSPSNTSVTTHTYTSSGWYNVCLTVWDSSFCQNAYCDSIYVNCGGSQNCSVNWTHTTQNCNVSFVSTVNPASSGWNYYWNFGDGGTSNQANPSHTYSSNGTYNVCLTAWNNLTQCSDTLCLPIQITNCGSSSNCQILFISFDSSCYLLSLTIITNLFFFIETALLSSILFTNIVHRACIIHV